MCKMQAEWPLASSGVPYDSDANEEHWGLVDIHRQPKAAFDVVKSFFNANNSSSMKEGKLQKAVYESSRQGARFHQVPESAVDCENAPHPQEIRLHVHTDRRKQTINGFGGSFTDASAYLVHQLSPAQRAKIIEAYFAEEGLITV